MDNLPPQLWGIWIPKRGWFKITDKQGIARAYAENRPHIAEHYAKWVGHGARVEPIDHSLEDGEQNLLAFELERTENNKWHILLIYLRRLFTRRR